MKISAKHRRNLLKLADYLESLPPNYKHFTMSVYADHLGDCDLPMDEDLFVVRDPKGFLQNCGAVACSVGHGPAAGIKMIAEEFVVHGRRRSEGHATIYWDRYSARVFGGTVFDSGVGAFLFSSEWASVDNHHYGAAARIRYYLDEGGTIFAGSDEAREEALARYAKYRKGSKSSTRRAIDAERKELA